MSLSLITTCKGRLHHLKQSLPTWVAQQGSNFEVEVLVVDYDCPNKTADWVQENFPAVRVVKLSNRPHFNTSKARNEGAKRARNEWLAFVDADVCVSEDFLLQITGLLNSQRYLVPNSGDPNTWGTCVLHRKLFESVGGYDELLDGYGGEDNELYSRLQFVGCQPEAIAQHVLIPIRHSDAERVAYFENQKLDRYVRRNHYYRMIKKDWMKLSGKMPDAKISGSLWNAVEAAIDSAAKGQPMPLQIKFPSRFVKTRPKLAPENSPVLHTTITYDIENYGTEDA